MNLSKEKVNININGTPKNNYEKLKVKSIETWRIFLKIVILILL